MKKIIYAAAVLAMVSVPLSAMAEESVTLYGQLRYSLNSVDEDFVGGQDGLSGEDNVSLLGLKGSYGEEVKAFVHLQAGANADGDPEGDAFDQRFFFGGLEGEFGRVSYGRMTNAYKSPGFLMDPFYNYSHVNPGGVFSAGGATYGLSGATNGFTDNSLEYLSPSLVGVKITGGLYIDDSNQDHHGYLAGASYDYKELNGGLVFASNDDNVTIPGIAPNGEGIRAYANYVLPDILKASVSLETVDITPDVDAEYLYLTGTMMVPSIGMDFSASIGVVTDGPAEGVGITGGAWYEVAKNTKLFALTSYADINPDAVYGERYRPLVVSIGAQHRLTLSYNSKTGS